MNTAYICKDKKIVLLSINFLLASICRINKIIKLKFYCFTTQKSCACVYRYTKNTNLFKNLLKHSLILS